jgi:hypothetical protein
MIAPGENAVSDTPNSEPESNVYPGELREILERAAQGDESALPALRKALDDHPELAAKIGDLVKHAEDAVLRWAVGTCLTIREAVRRQTAELRARLMAEAQSELERLLVDRVVLSWLEVYTADVFHADRVGKSGATPAAQAAQKILDRAHQRYLSAIRVLATVQKLARPSPAPVEIATRLGGTTGRMAARQSMTTPTLCGVEN